MKYLTGMDVFNAVRLHFESGNYRVVQLVPPGGQAPFGVTFYKEQKRSTRFPDLIAAHHNIIYVGELKSRYSTSDRSKLADIIHYCSDQILEIVERYFPVRNLNADIIPLLCHSEIGSPELVDTRQWIFTRSGELIKK